MKITRFQEKILSEQYSELKQFIKFNKQEISDYIKYSCPDLLDAYKEVYQNNDKFNNKLLINDCLDNESIKSILKDLRYDG